MHRVYDSFPATLPARALEPLNHNIRAFLTHETLSTPTPSYLVRRDLPARPTPDRFEASAKVRVLL